MNRPTDEYLLRRASQGDSCSMDALVGRYYARILDFAFRQTGNRETASDIAQLAFVRVCQSSATFAGRSSFRTWLYSITVNLIRDEMRRQGRRKESLQTDLNPDAAFDVAIEDPGFQNSESDAVWQSLDRLPEHQKMAVLLRFRHRMSHGEIAEALNAPEGTVRSWVHHALKSLRRIMDPDIVGLLML